MKLGDINLELIEPVEKNSPVSSFLSDGGGFHHLCFEVKDINEKISELEKSGARLLIKPVLGFEERQIAFLYLNMKNTNFNLIELATEK
jgi:methylmalonyl-CoA/ethylmalonyl-CoA epimerase